MIERVQPSVVETTRVPMPDKWHRDFSIKSGHHDLLTLNASHDFRNGNTYSFSWRSDVTREVFEESIAELTQELKNKGSEKGLYRYLGNRNPSVHSLSTDELKEFEDEQRIFEFPKLRSTPKAETNIRIATPFGNFSYYDGYPSGDGSWSETWAVDYATYEEYRKREFTEKKLALVGMITHIDDAETLSRFIAQNGPESLHKDQVEELLATAYTAIKIPPVYSTS